MSKGLDAAAAQELIEHALKSLTSEGVAAKAAPAIEAAFELARQSSRAAGKRSLSITSIKVGTNGEDDESVATIFQAVPPIRTGPKRIPIRYGGTGYMCFLVSKGPPPFYVCMRW